MIIATTTEGYLPPLSWQERSVRLQSLSALHTRTSSSAIYKRTTLRASKRKEEEENENEKGSKTGDLLRSVGGFFSFSSEEPKKEPEKEDDQGRFLSLFRRKRDTDEKAKIKAKEAAKSSGPMSFTDIFTTGTSSAKDANKEKQPQKRDEKKAKPVAKPIGKESKTSGSDDGSGSPSALRRIQGFLWFNPTTDNKKEPDKKKSDDSSYNPLSVVQNFAGSLRRSDPFSKNANKENWYPVFPKTRIMPGEIVPITVGGLDLLVIASIDSRSLYCIANSCPHLGTPLETGKLTRLPTEVKQPVASETTTSMDFFGTPQNTAGLILSETDISNILSQDGCEDCIVCPLHRTAFALKSGEVRGEWCPYPPVLGAIMGTVKAPTSAAVFDVRTRGKNVEVRLNSVLLEELTDPDKNQ